MEIAETSTPDLRSNIQYLHSQLLSQLESSIKELESQPPGTPPPETLSSVLTRLSSALNSVNLQLWKLSYRLWKACMDHSTAAGVLSSSHKMNEEHAMLRQISAPLQFLAVEVTGIPSTAFNSTSFYNETGLIWCDLRKFGHAGTCFEKNSNLASKIDTGSDSEERKLLLDLNIEESQTARELSDLTITLLNRSKTVLFGSAENYRALAKRYLIFEKTILSENKSSSVNESLKHEALDLSDKVLRIVKRSDETLVLNELKSKTLRFIAASHLQRDEFESVLTFGRVLRDGNGDSDIHPSVLAMKAWLGLERYGAITQVPALSACLNFSPDLFCLSAHEAVACRALLVAVASLSVPLNYSSSGKHIPTSEVNGPGTLVTILTQDPSHDSEVLKYIKRAHTRLSELGPDSFLGEDEARIREQNWFFKLASQFYGVIVDGEMDGDNVMVCNSIIPTVAAMLVDNERMVTLLNTEELLDRTGKMLFSCSAGSRSNIDQITNIEPNFFFMVGLKEDEEGRGVLDPAGSHNTSLMFQLHPCHLIYMTGLINYAISRFIRDLFSSITFVLVGSSGRATYFELFRPNTRDTTRHDIPYPITTPHQLIASDGFGWVVICEVSRITYLNLLTNQMIHLPPPPIPNLEPMLIWGGIAACFSGIPGGSENELVLVCPDQDHVEPNLLYWVDGEWSIHRPNLQDWHGQVAALEMRDKIIFVAIFHTIYKIQIRDDPRSLVTIGVIGVDLLNNRFPNIMSLTHEGSDLYLISVLLPNDEFGEVGVLRVHRISEVGELTIVEDIEPWMRFKSIFIVHGRRGQILPSMLGRVLSAGLAPLGFRSAECCQVLPSAPPNIIKLCSGHPGICRCNFAWCVDCF